MADTAPNPGGQPWTFSQLGGDKKKLTLTGWAAPFGRPRKSPVAVTPIEVRETERRYPGSDVPTRHLFGIRWDDIELHGRWMDSDGGVGFAKAQTENVTAFVADMQQVQITWGSSLSVTGLLKRLDPEWEGPADVAWKLRILVDGNDALKQKAQVPKPKSPGTVLNRLIEAMSDATTQALHVPPSLKPNLLTTLSTLVDDINAPAATLLNLSSEVKSFSTATIGQLQRLRGSIQEYRQALQSFRETYESTALSLAIEFQSSEDEIQLYQSQAIFGSTMSTLLKQLNAVDQSAAKAEQSQIKSVVTARDGDTWESISIRVYGSADRAADLRQTNSIPTGQSPIPGATYVAPV